MIYTIGHSNHEMEAFIALLRGHGVTCLADVRSHPYSRMYPQYCHDALKAALRQNAMAYIFLGRELGARSGNPACYDESGKVRFELLAQEPGFAQGIARLQEGMRAHCIALMCAEKDPLDCHRAILVARHLGLAGVEVGHILAHGQVETHADMESRMLQALKMSGQDMFCTRGQILAEAYIRQGRRIAYQDPALSGQNSGEEESFS